MSMNMTVKYRENKCEYDKYFKENDYGFRTKNSSYFKKLINYMGQMLEQVNFEVGENGIKVSSMDQGHVALVNAHIPLEFFSTYNFKNDLLGINLQLFNQILGQLRDGDELIVKYPHKCDKIDIIFNNIKYKKFYTMKLLDIEHDTLEITSFETPTKIIMETKYFNEIVKDFSSIGENVNIKIEKEKDYISFTCNGNMIDLVMELNNDELIVENIKNIEYDYCLKYFDIFSKSYGINKNMTIEIENDMPLKMYFTILETGFFEYYIAPKLTDDDFN